jgi:glycosyltransferase-like protein
MSQSLRIALFVYSTQPRGSVVHSLELGEALQALGHQVSLYALDKEGKGFGRIFTGKSHLINAQPVKGEIEILIQQRIRDFLDYLSDEHLQSHLYDCYHAQDCLSANALAILRSRQKIPHFIRTVHHIEAFNSPYLQDCQNRSLQEPDRCLCVSSYWQDQLRQKYQIEAPIVFNGVNLQRFSPACDGSEDRLKQTLQLAGRPLFLTVGGIEPRKNSLTLLIAFAQVLLRFPQAQLAIAGGATLFDYHTYREEFFALADHLGIKVGQSLILPGILSDAELAALYRLADAFVFPSLKEGWGLVLLEAIASGLPVITANQPPFTEYLSSQQALLVNPESAQDIAQAMLAVLQPEIVHPLIQNSQAVCSRYSWQTSAKMHIEQYNRLLTG